MKQMKKLLSVLLAVLMVFSLMSTALAVDTEDSMEGKVVILHSNDVHGAIEGYAKIAALRDQYKAAGAEVILADAGDFIQGDPCVSLSKGATAIEMMNAAGYDVATLGNLEFDYGYDALTSLLDKAQFTTLAANVFYEGQPITPSNAVIDTANHRIGVFGLTTPETASSAHPSRIQGLTFLAREELYACAQDQVDTLTAQE